MRKSHFMKSSIVALVLGLCSFAAFSQDSKKKDPFIGLEKKEVITQYGEPSRIEKNEHGGETLLYTRSRPTTASNQGFVPQDKYVLIHS